MLRGMTGFGSAEFSSGNIKGVVEIKSLNHRYLDLNYYFPAGFVSLESKIKDALGQHLNRGRVTISLKITNKSSHSAYINHDIIKNYIQVSRSLKSKYGLSGELTISDIMKFPGVVDTRETIINPEELWGEIEKATKSALKSLLAMRLREGKSLVKDISSILKRMLLQTKKIESRAKIIIRLQRGKFSTEEFSAFQKSNDINEEISRLSHHIDEARLLLAAKEPVGKKIDFIAQEMQRETNTIGSKLQDKLVTNAVIALKSKIEKIREQAQNIE